MSPKKQAAEALHRPASLKYFAHADAARVLIPRQPGIGYDVINLRKNPMPKGKRCWLVQLNSRPPFSISHWQLLSPIRFRRVALYQLSQRDSHLDRFLPDVVRLPEVGWREIVDRLIAILWTSGGGE
jgi:hypothetical protein